MSIRKLTGVVLGAAWVVAVAGPALGVSITTQTIVSGLNRAVDLASPPGDTQRLFVAERRGVIKIIDLSTNTVLATPFLDIDALVVNFGAAGGDERGLLGFTFHPDYALNGYFYVYYTDNSASPGDSVIARYRVSTDPNVADPSSALILKTFDQPTGQGNHKAGCLKFGPDRMLYVGSGDGGGSGDNDAGHNAIGNGQFKGTLLGKILRLDVDSPAPYIPADNPFIGEAGTLEEIFMIGLRNPFRFSFDSLNGDMYIGDVGQDAREEINYIPEGTGAGRNLGWRCMEANACFTSPSGAECTCLGANLTNPVITYLHNAAGGFSVTGGLVYRGSEIPGEYGKYYYADYISGNFWSTTIVGGVATGVTIRLSPVQTTIVSFSTDGNGEVYIVTGPQQNATINGGVVRKIVPLCNTTADINADCVRDVQDAQILVDVLLGVPVTDPALVNRSDVNDDGQRDGLDIQAWIAAL